MSSNDGCYLMFGGRQTKEEENSSQHFRRSWHGPWRLWV